MIMNQEKNVDSDSSPDVFVLECDFLCAEWPHDDDYDCRCRSYCEGVFRAVEAAQRYIKEYVDDIDYAWSPGRNSVVSESAPITVEGERWRYQIWRYTLR